MSREREIETTVLEDERLSYDGKDQQRIELAALDLTKAVTDVFSKLDAFIETASEEVHEDSASDMKTARQEVVESWALTQYVLSRLAVVMRIDGEQAFGEYARFIKSTDEDDSLSFEGM